MARFRFARLCALCEPHLRGLHVIRFLADDVGNHREVLRGLRKYLAPRAEAGIVVCHMMGVSWLLKLDQPDAAAPARREMRHGAQSAGSRRGTR